MKLCTTVMIKGHTQFGGNVSIEERKVTLTDEDIKQAIIDKYLKEVDFPMIFFRNNLKSYDFKTGSISFTFSEDK